MVGLQHQVAEARARGDVDLHGVELHRLVLGQQRLVAGEPRLRLLAPSLRVLAHPLELRGDGAAARALLAVLLGETLLLLLEPGRVVALEGDAPAAVQLQDPAGDVVEEVAVVGHRHDRALVLLEVALEPGHGLGVQVVGGLVQQQQVGSAQQEAAQGHAAALAARERGHVGVGGREAERVHGRLHHGVEVPGVGGLDAVLKAPELVRGLLRVVRGQLVEAVEQVAHLAHSVLHVAAHVLGLVQGGLLLQHPHRRVRVELGLAAVVGVGPGHDPEQGGLARAVVAQHADAGPGEEAQRDVRQHLLVGRVRARDLVHREDVFRGHAAGHLRGHASSVAGCGQAGATAGTLALAKNGR